jgi:cellulose synthase/poly-beta-1,6-N-acetylglucosamine synthase-like glycosyltransferase
VARQNAFPDDEFVTVHESRTAPEISMLMPVFEQEAFVGEAVRSVLSQEGVVCELIVSDDGSTDATFARALQAVESALVSRQIEHRIVMRRGVCTLRRDHPPLLEEAAACDLVAHAHGDDVSRPDRASRIIDAFDETGASLVCSVLDVIDESGSRIGQRGAFPSRLSVLTPEDIVGHGAWLVLASEAWRRSALAVFGRLDSTVAPEAHDRILPFRALLAGGAVGIAEPLVAYRDHQSQWSKSWGDERTAPSMRLSLALTRLVYVHVMRRDLETARDVELIDEERFLSRWSYLEDKSVTAWERLFGAYLELVRSGRQALWVTEYELRLANEGRLLERLVGRARRWGPVFRWVERGRARWLR